MNRNEERCIYEIIEEEAHELGYAKLKGLGWVCKDCLDEDYPWPEHLDSVERPRGYGDIKGLA